MFSLLDFGMGGRSCGPFRVVRDLRKLCGEERVDEALDIVVLMDQHGMPISSDIIYCLLQACTKKTNLVVVRRVHSLMACNGLDSISYLGDHLIRLFTLCGSLSEAKQAFSKVANPSIYTWHAIISAHTQLGESDAALDLYEKMQGEGVKPGKFIFLCILKACSSLQVVGQGRVIHAQIIRCQLESDVVIRNTLVDMYAKCGSLEEARNVFDMLQERDVVSWGAMIAGYAANGLGVQALELFLRMCQEGVHPNAVIFLCTLKACGSIGATDQGQLVHDLIIRTGLQSDGLVGSALVDMYAKCGNVEEARKVFDKLPNRDVVSWGAMIAGYAQHGQGSAALALYEKMQLQGIKPTKVTFLCILKACASIGSLVKGRIIHHEIFINKLGSDLIVGNALVDMYAKCGSLTEACKVFDRLASRDGVSWNAIILGYAQHGLGIAALEHFIEMQQQGLKPNRVTFLVILKVCCNIGAIRQGRLTHGEIIRRGFGSDVAIKSALVDMYAKCGSMAEAHKVFETLQNRDVISWGTIIAGYTQHGNYMLAKQCLVDLQNEGVKPDGWIYSSILAACSHAGQVEEGQQYFKSMIEDRGIEPSMEHFNCLIDLLSRSGRLNEARYIIQTMPLQPNVTGWTSLLTSCRMYGNMELGRECFDEAIDLDANSATGFVLMSNIYADSQMWDDTEKIQVLQKYAGVWKKPGTAWLELENKLHEFIMGDDTHPESGKLYAKSRRLRKKMEEEGYVAQLEVVLSLV